MQPALTRSSVEALVLRLVQPKDRQQLRDTIDQFVAPDVQFVHTLGLFEGRGRYYGALRVATALLKYERVEFRDVFLSAPEQERGGAAVIVVKAALTMVLRVRLRLLGPLSPLLDFPTIAVVHFRATKKGDADGPFLLCRHVDSNSLVALLTALSPLRVPFGLVERWVLPLFSACASVAAQAIDVGAFARDASCAAAATFLRPIMLMMD